MGNQRIWRTHIGVAPKPHQGARRAGADGLSPGIVAKVESLSEFGFSVFGRHVTKRFKGGEFGVEVAFWRHGIGFTSEHFIPGLLLPGGPLLWVKPRRESHIPADTESRSCEGRPEC